MLIDEFESKTYSAAPFFLRARVWCVTDKGRIFYLELRERDRGWNNVKMYNTTVTKPKRERDQYILLNLHSSFFFRSRFFSRSRLFFPLENASRKKESLGNLETWLLLLLCIENLFRRRKNGGFVTYQLLDAKPFEQHF